MQKSDSPSYEERPQLNADIQKFKSTTEHQEGRVLQSNSHAQQQQNVEKFPFNPRNTRIGKEQTFDEVDYGASDMNVTRFV